MQIRTASSPEDLNIVRELFEEYWRSFGFTPCFQGFAAEMEALPGHYAPPTGRLALAFTKAGAVGCVALRRLDDRRAEMKRLYVRATARHQGIGAALLEYVIDQARSTGCCELVADTLPVMAQALEMYQKRGFALIGPYTQDPTPAAVYIRLNL